MKISSYLPNISLVPDGEESVCNAGHPDLIPRLGLSPREGNGYPNFPLEKGMGTHSNILPWRIPRRLAGYSPWRSQKVGYH